MPVLTTQQRNTLESAVKEARKLAEAGARNALHSLAVDNPEPFAHMNPAQRSLRNRLRNKARLLGDELPSTGHQQIEHLSYELAYEFWHKMLFAKFLECNGLLMHPSGVAVTMEECEELAKEENFTDKWDAAAAYASKMLPAIFRPEDPLMQISFASNDRIKLEEILDGLDNYIFTADDSLGWVYQFWQSEAKEAINKSGEKINGEKLPAVTQLFTEPYMVHFLIDNTIGAWWISHHPNEISPVKFEYLRLLDDGTPAAGKFEDWPKTIKEITSLDPCMGSGHFIASLFPVFATLRMFEEGLNKEEATDKVIIDNLHGLELDARCTQIAAFNLALTAWKFCSYYKPLPEMNLACSGIAPKGKREDWVKLVGNVTDSVMKARMENGMKALYDHFQMAPELGSLIDPSTIKPDAFTASPLELQPVLTRALDNEVDNEQLERVVLASGITKSAQLLTKKYNLIITNVPYLAFTKQSLVLHEYSSTNYPDSDNDLATVFISRYLRSTNAGAHLAIVSPQGWLYSSRYKHFRKRLLENSVVNFISRLGAGAFEMISGEIVKVSLTILNESNAKIRNEVLNIDVSNEKNSQTKSNALKHSKIIYTNSQDYLKTSDYRITVQGISKHKPLSEFATILHGQNAGDNSVFNRFLWEVPRFEKIWRTYQNAPDKPVEFSGRSQIIMWEEEKGTMAAFAASVKHLNHKAQQWRSGKSSWGKKGVAVSLVGKKMGTLFSGDIYGVLCGVIMPNDISHLLPIWAYIYSREFEKDLKEIDPSLAIQIKTVLAVPFDLEYWQGVANEKYPNGLPKPYSDDPTQWLFHGNPLQTTNPFQVSVARLLGYRWPAENDAEMDLADEAIDLIKQIGAFDKLTDEDGILCIPSVNGELPAAERLRYYLQAVYGTRWNNSTLSHLLTKEGAKKSSLEEWLRDEFFEQHYKLFENRPFIWHIWDGRKDGFSALVNYHKLNKGNLQRLIFTYLGDWIRQCESKKKSGESGAEGLLAAATKLKEKLEDILEGESPYDIFVRWKPLEKQPIGWEPDLNDGVRLNIRPFILADVLRKKPNLKWGVDRGKNLPDSYWGVIRDNDKHLNLEEKGKARENPKNKNQLNTR